MIFGDLSIILLGSILFFVSIYMRKKEKPIAPNSIVPLSINVTMLIGAVGILIGLIRFFLHL